MTTYRFLFVIWEGGGNVPPILGLARRLVERGHSVRVISDPCNEGEIRTAGCEYTAYSRAPHRSDKSVGSTLAKDYEGSPVAGLRSFVRTFWSSAFTHDVLEELRTHPVDVCCVNDILISALFAPEKAGISTVLLIPNCNFLLPGPGVGSGGKAKVAFKAFLLQRIVLSQGMADLQKTRKALGLPPMRGLYAYIYQLSKVLILTSRAFDSKAEVAPNYQYIGPILDDPTWVDVWQSPWPSDHPYPLIVVSLSTTYQQQEEVLQKVLDALDGLKVRGLVTLGPTLDQMQFRIPANVVVCRSVPHAQVFPFASVVVSHGGHGTVTRALASGVPLICIPFGRDQPTNAAYVVAKGAGLKLGKKASVAHIREAIQRVIKKSAFRENARQVGKTVAEDVRRSTGVQVLEQVAMTTNRVLQERN